MSDPTSITIKGKELQLVTLDFETYYSQDFTLSGKMNMSEYVRDERFKAHGVSIKIGAQPTYWVRDRDIASELAKIKWDESALICHNTQFDGFIMSHHYGIVPAFYIDTLSMARGVLGHSTFHNLDTVAKMFGLAGKVRVGALLDTKGKYDLTDDEMEALGAYALDDVDDTEAIFHRMYPYLSDKELRLIDLTIRMFCDPILEVDIGRVHAEYVREGSLKDDSVKRAGVDPSDLSSNIKFAALLKARGVEPPMKESPTTGKQTYAFAKGDLDFQALLQHKDPQVRSLCEARLRIKSSIGETRAQRMLNAGDNGWKLPVALNYSGAHTHRWSGGNKMNLQNLPRGGELRLSILAPEGMHVVVADSAQIEARTLAWLAGQEDIIHAFANKQDVYKLMATRVYGVDLNEVTGDQRFIGKICVLGLGYGMGAAKLQHTLAAGIMGPPVEFSLEECQRIVNIYRSANYAIKDLWAMGDRIITDMSLGTSGSYGPLEWGAGFIRLPNGMFLQYPDLECEYYETSSGLQRSETTYRSRSGRTKLYGGILIENIVQALARIIVAEQMLECADITRVVTTTHDEIVAVHSICEAPRILERMIDIMSTPLEWCQDLPLSAEGGHARNYSK